ncbi:proline-rich receptor-like protein kinase PERK4 [Lingula anatina]|uniref:Proline-rich receptor-like protein kinase PERK4 n=1 Tax=Lingula anatina TaxID=7574 RepID=A0A2R2MST6_LINAN|nr:proline-rich receptor-like protein kinase PERK4 [Lingula anatina]|eukprot:XP_023933188.1 proline-rich receptor-like protein kinase PERK4 [Lingula anatina]
MFSPQGQQTGQEYGAFSQGARQQVPSAQQVAAPGYPTTSPQVAAQGYPTGTHQFLPSGYQPPNQQTTAQYTPGYLPPNQQRAAQYTPGHTPPNQQTTAQYTPGYTPPNQQRAAQYTPGYTPPNQQRAAQYPSGFSQTTQPESSIFGSNAPVKSMPSAGTGDQGSMMSGVNVPGNMGRNQFGGARGAMGDQTHPEGPSPPSGLSESTGQTSFATGGQGRGQGQGQGYPGEEQTDSRKATAEEVSALRQSGAFLLDPCPWPEFRTRDNLYYFNYGHLVTMTNGFQDQLAKDEECGFGGVHKGTFCYDGPLKNREIAVKRLKEGSCQGDLEFDREKEIAKLKYTYLLTALGVCEEEGGGYRKALVYVYMTGGTLKDKIAAKQLDWKARLRISVQLADAVCFLQDSGTPIFHRDIKPGNVFLDDRNNARLGDMGFARMYKTKHAGSESASAVSVVSKRTGHTPGYACPQYMKTGKAKNKTDCFSLGVVYLELLTNVTAIDKKDGAFVHDEWYEEGHFIPMEEGGSMDSLWMFGVNAVSWPEEVAKKYTQLISKCKEQFPKRIKPKDLLSELQDLFKQHVGGALYAGLEAGDSFKTEKCVYCLVHNTAAEPMECGCSFLCASCIKQREGGSFKCLKHEKDVKPHGEIPLSQLGQVKVPDNYSVSVMKSTVQFYKDNKDQAYRMSNHPKGSACIINVQSITIQKKGKTKVLPPRHGTDVDAAKLETLFKQLCFGVTVFDDFTGLTAQAIIEKLKNFAGSEKQKDVNCSVVCILSHGAGQDAFYGTDGETVSMDTVVDIFNNENCPALKGTPKLFFLQFCRGGREDSGVQADSDLVPTIPTRTDMLIGYPTEPGYVAYRDPQRGSWYIQTLVWVFMKFACCLDVCAMLNAVNKLMMNKDSDGNKKQMSLFKSMLTEPQLFLFPGIIENNNEAQQSNCVHGQS